jgi:DNA-binding transcriptional LysR family regulator
MDWDKLRIFYMVAQAGNLTRAAELLTTSQSSVSRQILSLEEKLKVPLFHRHHRGLVLTEQGDILYQTVSELVAKLQLAETSIAESGTKPRGQLKITAPVAFGSIWLAPLLKDFLTMYPDIEVSLVVDDRELDLAMREADVAIRMFESTHPDLIQIPLVELSSAIYASNDYLREFGTPTSLVDLQHHRVITYPENSALPSPNINWLMEMPHVRKMGLKPYMQVNSLNAMRRVVKSGMGIAALPDYIMYRARHISKILPDVKSPLTQVYYVYPLDLKNSRRVSVFRAFLERKIEEYNF